MQEWILGIIEGYGYIGIFLLILLENLFPPIPSEIILTFSGFMTSLTSLTAFGIIVISSLASYIGAVILYFLGKVINFRTFHFRKILGFKIESLDETQKWFDEHGQMAVFLGRLVPMIRSLISIPAGMGNMSFISFSLYSLLGTIIWNSALTYLGVYTGKNWGVITYIMKKYSLVVKVCVVVFILLYLVTKVFKKE